ncbi:MAG: hypothetical protein JST38_20775 [Bacteroidetes bacterium]|nr:hypothetical protein [Bacteroidota bacterium]
MNLQKFRSYALGGRLDSAARKGVAEAVATARAAGLQVEGYAANPVPQQRQAGTFGSTSSSTDEPKKKRFG